MAGDQLDDKIEIVLRRLKQAIHQNDKDRPDAIEDNEVVLAKNVLVSRKGFVQTRPGSTQVADDVGNNAIDALGHLNVEGGSKYQYMLAGGVWYRRVAGATSWTSIKTGLASGNPGHTLQAAGKVFVWDGVNNVQSDDGTTEADEGNLNTSFPRFSYGAYIGNRVIVGKLTDSLFTYSDVWTGSGSLVWDRSTQVHRVSDKDGGTGKAIIPLPVTTRSQFIYFKTNSYHLVDMSDTTPGNWKKIELDPVHGLVATRAAVAIGSGPLQGGVLFLSEEGSEDGEPRYRVRSILRTSNDAVAPGPVVSDDIETTLADINQLHKGKCAATFFNNKFILAFPAGSSSYNNKIAVLDLTTSDFNEGVFSWKVYEGWNAAVWDIFEESDLLNLYFGEASANSIVQKGFTGTSDNGTAISSKVTGRAEDGGYPEINKTWEFVEVFFLSTDESTAEVRAIFDDGQPTVLGTVELQNPDAPALPIALPFDLADLAIVRAKFPLDSQIARSVSIEVEHDTLDKEMKYLGYVLCGWAENLSLVE